MADIYDPTQGDEFNGASIDAPSTESFGIDKTKSGAKESPPTDTSGGGGNNFHRYNAQSILRDYFKDRDTYNFKHGLEFGLDSNLGANSTENALLNLDEDPTIFGFDIVILDKSPLFNDIDAFMDFGEANAIKDIFERRGIYEDFIEQFAKFFNVDDRSRGEFKIDSRFSSFKTHYLQGIQGLDKLVHNIGIGNEGGRQMADFGKDKITISLTEDMGINSGYLAAAYRSLMYAKHSGRQVIPENLMRFDMVIIVSEIRKFNRVSNALVKKAKDTNELIEVYNDNISRYVFTLHECQLDFNKYSFDDNIEQAGFGAGSPGESKGTSFDIYYKYVGMEMEKFNFHPSYEEESKNLKYINDQRKTPNRYNLVNDKDSELTEANESNKHPNRPIDYKFQMNTTTNSGDLKEYEFDFPMIRSKYAKNQIDIRNQNLNVEQSAFKTGLNSIIGQANDELQRKFVQARSQLVSDLAVKVRGVTGLRNISAPVNVYFGTDVAQLLIGKLGDFANLAVGTALSAGTGFLNKKAIGVENSVFDIANRGVDKIGGQQTPGRGQKYTNGTGIPNVYRK